MDIAVYCNGLPTSLAGSVFPVQSVYVAGKVKSYSKTKEHKCSIWYEKQYLENLGRNTLLTVFNPKCTIVGMQHLMLNSISAFLQTWGFPRRLHYCNSSVCMWSLPDISLSAYFIVGKASFLHKFWPHWTPSCMQRLLDIPWLTDHSTTAWMCGLACSEGAHHCEPWAGRFAMDGACRCVLELHQWLQFSPACQKYLSEVVILFWQGSASACGCRVWCRM